MVRRLHDFSRSIADAKEAVCLSEVSSTSHRLPDSAALAVFVIGHRMPSATTHQENSSRTRLLEHFAAERMVAVSAARLVFQLHHGFARADRSPPAFQAQIAAQRYGGPGGVGRHPGRWIARNIILVVGESPHDGT